MIKISDMISIVIPVYNAENSLSELYSNLVEVLENIDEDYEIIFIDDFSLDNSYSEIKEITAADSKVKALKLAKNFGQQNAILCGFNYISGDYAVTMDDDLQHKAEDIKLLYEKIKEGFDIVYAVPQNREYGIYRKLGSKLTNILFNIISSKQSDIRVSSFRIMKRPLVDKIVKDKRSFIYISALVLKHTDNIANINVSHYNRKHGESNYNFFKLLKLFLNLFIYYGNLSILKKFREKGKQYEIEETVNIE